MKFFISYLFSFAMPILCSTWIVSYNATNWFFSTNAEAET